MPIYAYRCDDCGHTKDLLRKLSDPPLVTCPSCGGGSFRKLLTAAGFQLKGSGWYATDFKNRSASKPKDGKAVGDSAGAPASGGETGSSADAGSKAGGSSGSSSAASSASGCGTSCGCH